MTNHWIDLKNSDCVLIMGSNAAENHPISFKWVMKAKDKGATLIHVDPRFTRTSAKCDVYAPIRSGSDIPFLGGLVKYILDNNKFFHDYVVNYTNASFVVGKDFEFNDGLFSGFDPKKGTYDKSKWAFEMDDKGVPVRDESLKNPRCVFNLLKKHVARYDVDTVSTVTGTPKEDILKVYETYAASGAPDKSATIMYAMGWTQHTVGVQNIRTMAMVQLLLGNIGVAGGGVNALRGESNVQGSTDHCLLVHILPGYLGTPKSKWSDLAAYNKNCTPQSADPMSANWWGNKPKYVSSFVKAMYPEASPEKGYEMLPKLDSHKQMTEYYWLSMFEKMHKGQFDGFFAWGQNPACGGANANKNREAMAELDWLVNVNIFDNETASFWRGPDMDPKDIKTEVFFLPCAVSIEKEGSVTNSGRWMQWRYRGPKPYGQTLPDGDIILKLTDRIQQLYKTEGGTYPDPIVGLGLNDWQNSHGHFDPHGIAKLINGYFLKDTEVKGKQFKKGQQVPSFAYLKDDGSTCSGNWLYCGSYTEKGNMAARRDKTQNGAQANIGLYPNWAWCWPVNRRILYNRASVDLNGKPYAPKKAVIEWTGDKTKWQGDIPDGGWKPGTKHAFIMRKHGFGQIYGPGRADGPFPEHYEPLECPIAKNPFSSQLHNPTAYQISSEEKAVANPSYPYVGTTYRVTEHWQTGLMTRYQGWLIETEPQLFCEISEELAKKENIENGETVHVSSLRGKLKCVAIVTKRIKPYKVHGQDVHLVGLPWHYGWVTPKNGGDSANLLTPSVGDPNTGIPETKAFMVNVSKIKRA